MKTRAKKAGQPPRPVVTANFAITADGRVSTRRFTPSDFSSPFDKTHLRTIRSAVDAVLVGASTVEADNMRMRLSDPALRRARVKVGMPAEPLRVIVSESGRIDPALRVFEDGEPPIVFSTTRMPARTRAALASRCDLHLFEGTTVPLAAALAILREEFGVKCLVCEGGPRLFRSMIEAGLVDELCVTICPRVFGGRGAPTLTGIAGKYLPHSTSLLLLSFTQRQGEAFAHYLVQHPR